MKHKKIKISSKDKVKYSQKNQDILLAKRFFPFYMRKLKYAINFVHAVHPKTSFLLVIKLLTISLRKKPSPNAIAFYKKGIKRNFNLEGENRLL